MDTLVVQEHHSRGSQEKNRIEVITPKSIHPNMTIKSTGSNPFPDSKGLKVACKADEKCFTGNILVNVINQSGTFPIGINISDIKSKGRIEALTMAGAAAELGINEVTAMPRLQNVAAPKTSVTNIATIVLVGTSTL